MDTTDLRINPIPDPKSEKKEKMKNAGEKVAEITAAMGLGVAGTMAAQAMTDKVEEPVEEIVVETSPSQETPGSQETQQQTQPSPGTETGFDPNEIVIAPGDVISDPVDIAVVPDEVVTDSDDVITVIDEIITDPDEILIDPEDIVIVDDEIVDLMYGGPDIGPIIDNGIDPEDMLIEDLLAEDITDGDIDDAIDLAADILS